MDIGKSPQERTQKIANVSFASSPRSFYHRYLRAPANDGGIIHQGLVSDDFSFLMPPYVVPFALLILCLFISAAGIYRITTLLEVEPWQRI